MTTTGDQIDLSEQMRQKLAAVQCWTNDPCGWIISEGELGTRGYFEKLLKGRAAYAPWMAHELGYHDANGLRVLDVGCGQGIDVANFARAGASVTGVDLTPRHVELAQRHLKSLGLEGDIVEGDAERLPFPDRSFDRVTSNGVLHHTPHIEAAIAEIRRVLKPGGEARIILYNRHSFHYWLTQVVYRGVLRGALLRERTMSGVLSAGVEYSRIGARPLVRVYSPRQARNLLRKAGFEAVGSRVRHFNVSDTPVTHVLARVLPALRKRSALDHIGRLGGWYVIASGFRPDDGAGER
jgi:ubiquinone/menaquinone biosynthesis C-methylase UbiE